MQIFQLFQHQLRRSSSKLSVAKIESVSLSQSSKKDDTSGTLFGGANSLIPTSKMLRIRRRGDDDMNLKKGLMMVHSSESIFTASSLPDTDCHDLVKDYLVRRRRSNTLPGSIGPSPTTLQVPTTSTDVVSQKELTPSTEKVKPINLNFERKSKSLKKLKELVEKVLRKNLEHCRYDAEQSRKRCTLVSQILETTLKSSLNSVDCEYKIVIVVYIGELREDGMKQSCQYVCNPVSDLFVMETFRGEDMFATGIVFATLVENNNKDHT